jgi:mannose-6-phosphate isomerase-like protein (cupin superfamily)
MSTEGTTPAEFWTSERCFITEYLNRPSLPSVSLARARVEPGVTTAVHSVTVDEWYLVQSGQGLMRLGTVDPFPVGPGDSVHIPPGCPQNITNTGAADLLFLCVCVPRFTHGGYRSLS